MKTESILPCVAKLGTEGFATLGPRDGGLFWKYLGRIVRAQALRLVKETRDAE